ncbi:YbfB/YjiJ family MFS transporter [Enterovirga aerilata]|uniref:YbfB/YjiJ family MFS transporter n=1 Tax=Enterovirga aerilata TaxID=2730920 RepID=A0A849ICA4_9HYPH|nr:YbfB/YjiJ family MFS transporter [Enterovirga sp. DB1703]NNM74901.1 YbfB/YjiJ family MFS transporter [Enterovirga sp. DB1703]
MSPPRLSTGLRPAFAGAAATCSGIGLSRFAYVPLFPAMVAAGWVSGAEGGVLGALNLAGYLLGVLGGRMIARRLGTARTLDLGMALAVLGFAACAANLGATWLASWRFVSGAAGGILMALAGPAVQGAVEPVRRGMAGGIVIGGVAIGIMAASGAVPAALALGIPATWLLLAGIVAALWAAVHRSWPDTPIPPPPSAGTRARSGILQTAYGLSAAGLVPHMVYFADLAIRGHGLSPAFGAALWLVFGAGGLAGTLLAGSLLGRLGALPAFRLWLALQVAALAAALSSSATLLSLSAFAGGFSTLGLTTIALARARELAGPGAGAVWVKATAAFAVAQAGAGFALAAIFARTGSHQSVFLAGLVLSGAALLVSFVGADRPAAEA